MPQPLVVPATHLAEANTTARTRERTLAWSFAARWQPPLPECRGHRRCNNCVTFALRWRRKVLNTIKAAEGKTVTAASLGGVEL